MGRDTWLRLDNRNGRDCSECNGGGGEFVVLK